MAAAVAISGAWIRTPLKKEMLIAVRRAIELSSESPQAALKTISTLVHAAKLGGLRGAHRFLATVHDAIAKDESTAQACSRMVRPALTVFARYLERVIGGEAVSTLVLFKAQQALAAAAGLSPSPEGALFYPWSIPVSVRIGAEIDGKMDFTRLVDRGRAEYLEAVRKVDEFPEVALPVMRDLLLTMEARNPHAVLGAFFELSSQAVESMLLNGIRGDRHVVDMIESGLKLIATASFALEDDVLSCLLFVIAKAQKTTPRLAAIRSKYRLEELIGSIERTQKIFAFNDRQRAFLQEQLGMLEREADQASVGNVTDFLEITDKLCGLKDAPDPLVNKVGEVMELIPQAYANAAKPADAIAEAAVVIYILRDVVNDRRNPGQAAFIQRELDIMRELAGLAPQLPAHPSRQTAFTEDFRQQLMIEVRAELDLVEVIADAIMNGAQYAEQGDALGKAANKILGALTLLGEAKSASLMAYILEEIKRGREADQDKIIEGMGYMATYVDIYRSGAVEADSLVDFGLALFGERTEAPLPYIKAAQAEAKDVAQSSAQPEDEALPHDLPGPPVEQAKIVELPIAEDRLALESEAEEASMQEIPEPTPSLSFSDLAALARVGDAPILERPPEPVSEPVEVIAETEVEQSLASFLNMATLTVGDIEDCLVILREGHTEAAFEDLRFVLHGIKDKAAEAGLFLISEALSDGARLLDAWAGYGLMSTPEFCAFITQVNAQFEAWVKSQVERTSFQLDLHGLNLRAEALLHKAQTGEVPSLPDEDDEVEFVVEGDREIQSGAAEPSEETVAVETPAATPEGGYAAEGDDDDLSGLLQANESQDTEWLNGTPEIYRSTEEVSDLPEGREVEEARIEAEAILIDHQISDFHVDQSSNSAEVSSSAQEEAIDSVIDEVAFYAPEGSVPRESEPQGELKATQVPLSEDSLETQEKSWSRDPEPPHEHERLEELPAQSQAQAELKDYAPSLPPVEVASEPEVIAQVESSAMAPELARRPTVNVHAAAKEPPLTSYRRRPVQKTWWEKLVSELRALF